MALPPEIREAAERSVAQFCADRSSEDHRIEPEIRGLAITLKERRPPWQPGAGAEWSSLDVAQLRYSGSAWSLYWKRATGRWERYDRVGPAADVEPLLAEIDADPDGAFWAEPGVHDPEQLGLGMSGAGARSGEPRRGPWISR